MGKKIATFEELQAWQKARMLAVRIYHLTQTIPFAQDFGLRDQIQRAASSIMHNIAEGFEAGSDKEFIRFLRMARRSAAEVQSQLYLACDLNYITDNDRQSAHALATETKRLINGLIGYLTRSNRT